MFLHYYFIAKLIVQFLLEEKSMFTVSTVNIWLRSTYEDVKFIFAHVLGFSAMVAEPLL